MAAIVAHVQVIADYPDRRFQIWEYRVSHGSLLVRSPKGPRNPTNVDLVFVGVEYLALPRLLRGVMLVNGTEVDRATVSELFGPVDDPDQVFILISQSSRFPVVAVACQAREHDFDIFQSLFSP